MGDLEQGTLCQAGVAHAIKVRVEHCHLGYKQLILGLDSVLIILRSSEF